MRALTAGIINMKRIITSIFFVLLFASTASADRTIYTGETTAAERRIPIYLVEATDGETPETGVTISGGECRISKNGGTSANCAGSVVENETGLYYYQASTGDIDTLGYVTVRILDSAADVFIGTAEIVAYDPTDAQWTVDIAANGILPTSYAPRNTAQAYTATSLQMASVENFADNVLKDNSAVVITGGGSTIIGQVRCIRANTSSDDTITVDTFSPVLSGTVTYDIIPAPGCTITSGMTDPSYITEIANTISGTAVTIAAGGLTGASIGDGSFSSAKFATGFLTSTGIQDGAFVVGKFADGFLTANKIADNALTANKLATNAIGADEISADAVTKIALGVASGGGAKTAQSATTLQVVLASSDAYGTNALANHNSIYIESATLGKGQVRCIKSNTNTAGANRVTLSEAFRIAPTAPITYRIIQTPNCNTEAWSHH